MTCKARKVGFANFGQGRDRRAPVGWIGYPMGYPMGYLIGYPIGLQKKLMGNKRLGKQMQTYLGVEVCGE